MVYLSLAVMLQSCSEYVSENPNTGSFSQNPYSSDKLKKISGVNVSLGRGREILKIVFHVKLNN